jgi:hypothetical protein
VLGPVDAGVERPNLGRGMAEAGRSRVGLVLGVLGGVVVLLLAGVVAMVWLRGGAGKGYAEAQVTADMPLERDDQVIVDGEGVVCQLRVDSVESSGAIKTAGGCGSGDGHAVYPRDRLRLARVDAKTDLVTRDLVLVKTSAGWQRAEVVTTHASDQVELTVAGREVWVAKTGLVRVQQAFERRPR